MEHAGLLEGVDWTRVAPVFSRNRGDVRVFAVVPRLRNGRLGAGVAALIAVATSGIVVLKVAEVTVIEVLDRPFNPLLDARLARSGVNLLTEALGGPLGWASVAALALAPIVVCAVSYAAVRRVQRTLHERFARQATVAACATLVALFAIRQVFDARYSVVWNDASRALSATLAWPKKRLVSLSKSTPRWPPTAFRPFLRIACSQGCGGPTSSCSSLSRTGRSAVELPRYARTTASTLATFEERLAARGLSAVSAWLTSPTAGGQSWLPTGTLASGLGSRIRAATTLRWKANASRWSAPSHAPAIAPRRSSRPSIGHGQRARVSGSGTCKSPLIWATPASRTTG